MENQRRFIVVASAICCIFLLGADWPTDGGDNARSGWQKNEHILTKENVKGVHLLWKLSTGEQPRALHTMMAPLVVDNVPTADGPKELVYVEGVNNDLFAIDPKTGTQVWKKHFTPATPPPPQGGPPNTSNDPRHFGFLNPGGTTAVPVVGPADASGVRPIYIIDGSGDLHVLSTATGEDMKPAFEMGIAKFGLQLYKNDLIFAGFGATSGIVSTDATDPTHAVTKTTGFGNSGGLWGRRGPTIDSKGTVYTTTGDGNYDPSNPDKLILANSVVGFEKGAEGWKVKDWFTPPNWEWLWKRDLDPNNTPTVFMYKGRELMAASGKECRVYLLDPKNMGGPDHHVPLYKTPLFCNEAVDFQNAGSWGAVSSWEDASGTRWVVVPFWGPVHSKFKFPTVQQPVAVEGGVAAFKVTDTDGKLALEPVWVSRDMHRGEPPIIANGMVFGYGSGENTQQAWTDIGLQFDSSIRAAKSGHATIFVMDATTGRELWTSGDQITSFSHFSGITVANGRFYLGTYDGTLYCFGL